MIGLFFNDENGKSFEIISEPMAVVNGLRGLNGQQGTDFFVLARKIEDSSVSLVSCFDIGKISQTAEQKEASYVAGYNEGESIATADLGELLEGLEIPFNINSVRNFDVIRRMAEELKNYEEVGHHFK